MLGLCRSPITSDRSVLAGELSPALPMSCTRTRRSAQYGRLAALSTPVSSALLSFPTDCRLQAPDFHAAPRPPQTDCAWRSTHRYIGSVRRSLTSALSPLIPTGSAPFPILIRFSERADVREDSDPARRADVCENSDPARRGNPRICLGSTAVRCGLAVAGAKIVSFSEMKVR